MQPRNISVSVIVVSVLIFVFACATAKPQFKEARRIDTIAAYQEFVRNHPKSELAVTAKTRIEEINFEAAKSVHTVLAYEQFIDASNSELFKNYANQLILKIYEDDYQKAKEIASLEAYQTYLKKYPKSIFLTDCQMRIEAIVWNRTIKENTVFSYYRYLNTCSTCGRHDQEADNRFKMAVKSGVSIDVPFLKSRIEKILSRPDIVIIQTGPKGTLAHTGPMRLEKLIDAEDVSVRIAKDVQAIRAGDLATGNYESVEKLRLKHRVPENGTEGLGFSTIIVYSEENGPTDVIFIADGKGYFFQETGPGIF